jgi:gluconate transporter
MIHLLADATKTVAPPVAPMIALLFFGIAFLLVLILRFKLQAFLALLVVSVLVSIGATFVNPDAAGITEIGTTITKSMGGALGFIATIIGVGAIFGAMLEHSGGTQALANTLLKRFGTERAPWAMLVTGFIISIPVFLDVALVILAPLLYALARDTKKPLLVFGLPLVAGMIITHAFVPPTPGPVAVAYFLEVSLGHVIMWGVAVGLPTAIICGPWLCSKVATLVDVPIPDHATTVEPMEEAKLPPFSLILALIVLPIALILCNTIIEQRATAEIAAGLSKAERGAEVARLLSAMDGWKQALHFIGHPVISLMLATLLAIWFLGTRRGATKEQILEISTKALGPAGIIILITGAGGVFKGVLKSTGIDVALTTMFASVNISLIVLAWVFATLIRIAQGSATIAMLTAAGLMTAFVALADPALSQSQLALITCAIASGATGFSHVNDSGFWMISRYMGMNEKQTLKTWTLVSTAISLVSFTIILIAWQFV